ncbi:Glycerophosphodiester phosphodiesterase gdpd6 [Ancistrocladus abbreviatus]
MRWVRLFAGMGWILMILYPRWFGASSGSNTLGVTFALLLLIAGCGARQYPLPSKLIKGTKQPLQTSRPYNFAHRGSNGELPEETAPAYLRAIEEGADFIETDILATKDGVLVCHHDVTLDDTTDVADHKEFADRKRTLVVQGVNTTGFFVVDFTWTELQTLRAKQRYSFRDQQYNGKFPIITFDEYISIALDAPRVVGIYPEIKNPVHINDHVKWPNGKKYEDMFLDTLEKYGYKGSYLSEDWLKQPCFIQSFAPTSLVYASNKTDLPLIFLIDDVTVLTEDTNQTYYEITSDEYLDYIKQYVVGIGPWKDTVVPVVNNYLIPPPSDLVAKAHARGLQVHPYTYRLENQFLHFDFHQDPYNEFDFWINKVGVDGLFTDFTGSLHQYQEWTSPLPSDHPSDTSLWQKIKKMLRGH